MKKNINFIFCFLSVIIVFLFYAHTLTYPWKHFDEQIIYNETLLPIPLSFSQIFEYITNLGINNYIEASNPFYTTISSLRNMPVLFDLTLFFLFKKSAFAFHLFSLVLHLLNSCLCFLILNTFGRSQIICFILTLLWALHPVNVESILFATNFGALLTYFFCFLIFYIYITAIHELPLHECFIIFLLYLVPLYLNEYSVTLPIVLSCYLFATSQFNNPQLKFKENILLIIKKTLPLYLGLLIFTLRFFFSSIPRITHESSSLTTFERIFWLAPQIFLHHIKLILFPFSLSIDQSTFVKLSNIIFEPYGIFCSTFMLALLLFALISLFSLKRRGFFYFFILFIPFFISLLPFLHILAPIYNLACERYLYFPLFLFILGICHCLNSRRDGVTPSPVFNLRRRGDPVSTVTILCIILCILGIRTLIRTLDWKDSTALFSSAYKTAQNTMFKGLRLQMLGAILISNSIDNDTQIKGQEFIKEGIKVLEKSFFELEEKKQKYQDKVPQIIKTYGLDPKTLQGKTTYLLAFSRAGLDQDSKKAYELLKPLVEDLTLTDTQILDFYLRLLTLEKKLNEAESILKQVLKTRPHPTGFITLAEIETNKYKNIQNAEALLRTSFEYFPYDANTLESLKNYYLLVNRGENFAFYSYLHGIRTHSKASLEAAYNFYLQVKNNKMANTLLKNIKLIN